MKPIHRIFIIPGHLRFCGLWSYAVWAIPALFFLLMPVLTETAQAQNSVRILQSDRLEGVTTEEGRIRKLTGNVKLETDDFTIVCDSAWQYLDQDELVAYGNINIESDREQIWADTATYDLDSEITLFEGRVIMRSENAQLFSEEVYYSFATEIALFPEYLRLEDDRGVLAADSGYYYNALDSAIFRGNVQMSDTLQYIEADSLFTKREEEYYELHGRVFLDDQENRTRLSGDFLQADSTGYRRVETDTRLRRINDAGTDTTFLWSDRLEIQQKDTIDTFTAYEDVHIWSEAYSSLSDTAHYDGATGEFLLTGSPRLWYDELQLTGPEILIQMEEDSVRYLKAPNRPFATQHDPSTERFNQITGDTIYIRFENGEVSYMDTYPNGNILYFIKDNDGNADGAIEMTAGFIKIEFTSGELDSVIARRNIDGDYLPESPSTAERQLEGFIWEPEIRPRKPDTPMEPRLPPIPEERPFTMPPLFREED